MADVGAAAEQRPSKRAKNIVQDRGPDLRADLLFKYNLQLPQSFTPGAIQANRLALRVQGDRCLAYAANAQHVYEVSLGSDLVAPASTSCSSAPGLSGVDQGKEGVLVPRAAQVGHIRQLDHLSYMEAEVQGLYAGVHGSHHLIAAVDAVGNARLLAEPLGGSPGAEAGSDGAGLRCCMSLRAPYRGECGWTGLAVRSRAGAAAAAGGGVAAEDGGGGPVVEVAVARQQLRDVNVYRDGELVRTLHTLQGPSALTYLHPGPSGGAVEAATFATSWLLAVAEEHQISLWDVRQGERGGCTQRLNVYGGGNPVYGLSWVSAASSASRQNDGGGSLGDGGMLAVTGWERSVVMLEPRKWHIVTKWPGCVKYPATHMVPSAAAPGYVYVAGLDYEAAAGRWDGSCGSSAGNANSSSGGHGRATGPAQLKQLLAGGAAAVDDGVEGGGSRGGLSFRGDSKWLGLARESLSYVPQVVGGSTGDSGQGGGRGTCREVAAALSLSGHLFVLVASASAEAPVA